MLHHPPVDIRSPACVACTGPFHRRVRLAAVVVVVVAALVVAVTVAAPLPAAATAGDVAPGPVHGAADSHSHAHSGTDTTGCPPPPCSRPELGPRLVVGTPQDGTLFSNTSSVRVEWAVECVAYPCASYVMFWDVTGGDGGMELPGIRINGHTTVTMSNLEPGSYFVALTLHNAVDDAVIHTARTSFEVFPAGLPHVDPQYVAMTMDAVAPEAAHSVAADGDADAANATTTAPSVLYVGDTQTFDGMKSFFVDYMSAFLRRGVSVAYLDPTCLYPNVDTAGALFPAASNTTQFMQSAVVEAVVATGARLVRWCMECPTAVCPRDSGPFERMVARDGPLPRARTWDDVPAAGVAMMKPLADFIATFDVIVMAWRQRVSQGSAFFLPHAARLSNPAIVRYIDLGPGYEHVPPDVWVTDFFMAPSNFVKLRPTVVVSGVPTHVVPPLIDVGTFAAASAPPPTADVCATAYGKGRGDGAVLVGFVARVTSTKSPGMFVRAAAEVLKVLPNARFVMAGAPRQPSYLAALLRLAEQLGVGHAVKALGFLPRHQLLQLYQCMDVLLCTSATNYETFGIVNAEAMAMAVPVVHYGVAGIQDYVRDGVHSVAAKGWGPVDVAAAVVDAAGRANDLGAAARQFVATYLSEDVTAPRVLRLLTQQSDAAKLDQRITPVLELTLKGRADAGNDDGANANANATAAAVPLFVVAASLTLTIPDDAPPAARTLIATRHQHSVLCVAVGQHAVAQPAHALPADAPGAVCSPLLTQPWAGLVVPPGVVTVSAWVRRKAQLHRQFEVSASFHVVPHGEQ